MNEVTKPSIGPADAPRIWYPLHPRWIPLLRLAGALGVIGIIYTLASQQPAWSSSTLTRCGIPALLILSCLCVQPDLRTPTVLNRIGRTAHLLLVFLILPLAVVTLILYWCFKP